jgi:hypothetical protein
MEKTPRVVSIARSSILFLRRNFSSIFRASLYLGVTYLALFTGAGTCHGQGCSYYDWHGHCQGASPSCNTYAYSAYSSFSDCHDVIDWAAYTNFCGGYGCSTGPISCNCVVAPPTDIVTVSDSISCATTGPGGWCSGSATLTVNATDSLGHTVAISGTYGGSGFSCASAPCVVSLPEGSGAISYTGTCSGGQTNSGSDSWQLDKTPPTVGYSLSGGTPGGGGWYLSGPVTMTCSGSDALSGLYGITYGAQIANGYGANNLSCTATDNAGNTASTSATVNIDNVAPVVSLLCNGAACVSGWYGNVTLTANATDAMSGVSAGSVMVSVDGGATWSASATVPNGVNAVQARAFDVAGNTGTASGTVRVDTTVPSLNFNYSGNYCTGGWYNTLVQISIEAHDLFSGITSLGFTVNGGKSMTNATLSADGTYSLDGFATNGVGNTAHIGDSIQVDSTPPVSAWATDNNSWVGGKATFTGTSTDLMSGISEVFVSTDNGATWVSIGKTPSWSFIWDTQSSPPVPDGTYTLLARANDNACNHEHTAKLVVNVDNTPPTLKLQDSFNLLGRSTQIFNSDMGSGMAKSVATISGNGIEPVVITFGSPGNSEELSWNGMAGDGKVAPFGIYDVVVDGWDKVGNHSQIKGTWVRPAPQAPTAVPAVVNPVVVPTPIPASQPANPVVQQTATAQWGFMRIALFPAVSLFFLLCGIGVARIRDRRPKELHRFGDTLQRIQRMPKE